MLYGTLVNTIIDNELEYLRSCSYGIPISGSLKSNFTEKEYKSNYHLLSPELFRKYNGGVCYDYVNYLNSILRQYKNYFIEFPKIGTNHTICVSNTNKKPFAIYEFSDKRHCGIHQKSDLDSVFDTVLHWMIGKRTQEIEYRILEYPSFLSYSGCSATEFRDLIERKSMYVRDGKVKR